MCAVPVWLTMNELMRTNKGTNIIKEWNRLAEKAKVVVEGAPGDGRFADLQVDAGEVVNVVDAHLI